MAGPVWGHKGGVAARGRGSPYERIHERGGGGEEYLVVREKEITEEGMMSERAVCPVCNGRLEEVKVPVYERFEQLGIEGGTHFFIKQKVCKNCGVVIYEKEE